MRLTEFYCLNEARARYFTLEPEANGVGRLLSWERISYSGPGAEEADAEDDTSYEPVAHGSIDKLMDALRKMLPSAADREPQIRSAWEAAVDDGGEAVYVDDRGIDIQLKVRDTDRDASWEGPWDEE